MYCTECKLKNKKRGKIGTRLSLTHTCMHTWFPMKQFCNICYHKCCDKDQTDCLQWSQTWSWYSLADSQDFIDLICETILYYIIHFRMAKAHECPLAAVCMAVSRDAWKAVALSSFNSPRPQTWWNCRKKLLNDRNGRRQRIVVLVEVSSLLLLPKVATAGKNVWMVNLLGSELGSLLRHGNSYCALRPSPSFIWL